MAVVEAPIFRHNVVLQFVNAELVNITPITRVYDRYLSDIYIIHGGFPGDWAIGWWFDIMVCGSWRWAASLRVVQEYLPPQIGWFSAKDDQPVPKMPKMQTKKLEVS